MIGIVLSNFVFNTYLMARPIEGAPVKFSDYFKGEAKNHLAGVAGGIVWAIGTSLSIIAAARAGYAISFGLGQGATMIGAFWGVFIWKEFRNAPRGTNYLLALMFISFIAGLVFIIISGR
jgi:glucose uptake protein